MKKIAFFLSFFLLCTANAFSTIYYVNASFGDDLNNGLYETNQGGQDGPKKTINAAMALVQSFDTLFIAAGIYHENLTIDSLIYMEGAGSCVDSLTNTILQSPNGGSGTGITFNSTGQDSLNRMVLKNLRVDDFQYGITFASHTSFINVAVVNCSTYGFYHGNGQVEDIIQHSCDISYNQNGGIFIGHTADVDGWLIDSCLFDSNNFSAFYIFCDNPSTANVSNLIFRNSVLRKNFQKGMYIEKLQDALFENLIIDSCGYNPNYNYNTGMDINLKYNDYSNITIKNCDFRYCGLGGSSSFGSGLIVKGRDDGATYGANLATLDSVFISSIQVNNCLNGIIIGEPNAGNATPTNVHIELSDISGNVMYNLINEIENDVVAHNNWWGANAWPDTSLILIKDTGAVYVITWLENGADSMPETPGFMNMAPSTFDPEKNTLQEAINVLPEEHVLIVPQFTYNGLTEINSNPIFIFEDSVQIESLFLNPNTEVNVISENGFAVNQSITLSDTSYMYLQDNQPLVSPVINLLENATLMEDEGNVIRGEVDATRLVNTAVNTENFGGLGLEVTTSNSAPFPGNVELKRFTGNSSLLNLGNVRRMFEIIPENDQGLDLTLTYLYDPTELDAIEEDSILSLYRSIDNGNTWDFMGGEVDTILYKITLAGVDEIGGLWTAFDSIPLISIKKMDRIENILIFPNPNTGGILMMQAQGPLTISIFDQTGRVVQTESIDQTGSTIKQLDIRGLSTGLYLLQSIDKEGLMVVKKLIKD